MLEAIGWYRDPYGVHEDRYFSQGFPTKLVRDGGVESYDPPPGRLLPDDLIPVPAADPDVSDAADLRRADEAGRGEPFSRRRAMDAVCDVFDLLPPAQ